MRGLSNPNRRTRPFAAKPAFNPSSNLAARGHLLPQGEKENTCFSCLRLPQSDHPAQAGTQAESRILHQIAAAHAAWAPAFAGVIGVGAGPGEPS